MKCHWIVASLVLVCLAAPHARCQTRSEEVQRLREEMQSLQEQLRALENAPPSATRERTTLLGRSRAREEEPELAVRIYDLSDLLAMVIPYPAMIASDLDSAEVPLFPSPTGTVGGPSGVSGMGGMGGMGGAWSVPSPTRKSAVNAPQPQSSPLFQVAQSGRAAAAKRTKGAAQSTNSVRIDLDELINAITTTIEPSTWTDVGGPGSIAPLGNSLIISAAPRTHNQITALLDTFRKRWGTLRTVSVEAHWLWLTDGQLTAILAAAAPATPGEPQPFGLVNPSAWDAHMKELRKPDADQPAGYQAVVTCYNGQTVHTVSGGQRQFVVGMTPVVGGGGTADSPEAGLGYEPQVATLQEGAALQVTPMTTTAGKFVVLDVHSRVVRLSGKGSGEARRGAESAGPGEVVKAIDRPAVANSHLETTLRVPVDRRVLVGGMTFHAQPTRTPDGEVGLYLFVKLAVKELRDDLPEAKPAPPPKTPPAAKPKKA